MAIISEQAYIADGTQREFQVVGKILSDSHIGVWIVDYSTTPVTETRLPTAHYDVLGSIVLLDVPPQAGLTVSLVLTDNGEGIEIPPSEITDISANINKIINVSDNIERIITNSDNMQSIIDTASIKNEVVDVADIKTQVVSISNDKIKLDSIYSDKAKLDSIFADKATLDSIFADKLTLDALYSMKKKLDSLYADKNTLDSLYADKTELDTIYANINAIISIYENIDNVNYFADRYLGDRDIEPTTRLDGSPLLYGDLYFDKTIQLMRVYSNEGWKVAYAQTDSYTKAEIENLFVGVSGDQTVYDVKTFNLPIVGSITGNSGTATKLQTAITINGVNFDGTANIVVSDETAVKLTGNQTIEDVKTFTSSPTVPTPTANTQAANKGYVDSKTLNINSLSDKPTPDNTDNFVLQEDGGLLKKLSFANLESSLSKPTLTANATLTGINNKIVMNGIVTSLGLEIGDVIQFTSEANANNQKIRTVESIINNNEIIVNYEHCGGRGNGTLKLTDETLTNATIKRIAKWYNAPIGLGQRWVTLTLFRVGDTNYTNTTKRTISVFARLGSTAIQSASIIVDGVATNHSSFEASNGSAGATGTVNAGGIYKSYAEYGFQTVLQWTELR